MDERTARAAFETLDEFAATLDDAGPYVPPGYEVADGGDEAAHADGGANALDGVLDRLDGSDPGVVVVAGESGAGKSRLLAEVGRALRDREDATVRYLRGSLDGDPPSVDDGTVLCLDDAGQMAAPDEVLRLAGEAGTRVVAAARPVHAGTLAAGALPDDLPRHELALSPLDESDTVDLLAAADVPAERARAIHEATGGNPFLSRRLAAAGTAPDDTGAAATAVAELLPDETGPDLPADPATARALLTAVAVLGAADASAAAAIAAADVDPDAARRTLAALCDAGLIDAVAPAPPDETGGEPDGAGSAPADGEGTTYALHGGVLAESLRHRALGDEMGVYDAAIDRRLATDAPGVARGLVELRQSPLLRTGAVDADAPVRPVLGDVAEGVADADAPLTDVLRVAALVAFVAPGVVPYEAFEARYEAGEPSAADAGHLYRFVGALYRHAAATAGDEYDLPLAPGTLLGHARAWLDRLNGLAIDRPDDAALQRRLAHALRDAAAREAAAGRFEGAATCLDRLDVLAGDYPDREVRRTFATALGDTASSAGAAGQIDHLGTHVDRLSALAEAHPEDGDVREALATALVNATNYEGDAERFDALAGRIDRLSGLAEAHPDGDLDRRLARGLLNAASAESGAGRFEDANARVDRLSALAEANPDSAEIRHRFAQALLSVVDREAGVGRFDGLDARLDRLTALAEANPDQSDLRHRLAQALFAVVDSETDAERFDALSSRVDRLVDLAGADDDAVQVPAIGGCFISLRGLVAAGEYETATEVIEALGTLADRPGGLRVGSKGADVQDLSTATGERLIRDGRLDLFERFAAVLADGLSDGRWRTVSSDLIMTADTLVGEGAISMDDYRRVVECCDD